MYLFPGGATPSLELLFRRVTDEYIRRLDAAAMLLDPGLGRDTSPRIVVGARVQEAQHSRPDTAVGEPDVLRVEGVVGKRRGRGFLAEILVEIARRLRVAPVAVGYRVVAAVVTDLSFYVCGAAHLEYVVSRGQYRKHMALKIEGLGGGQG